MNTRRAWTFSFPVPVAHTIFSGAISADDGVDVHRILREVLNVVMVCSFENVVR